MARKVGVLERVERNEKLGVIDGPPAFVGVSKILSAEVI